jgi:UDP-N-acetylmuramate: L-alanyl-gamma-D-glutamyl-meso-diaminopimelate ligase
LYHADIGIITGIDWDHINVFPTIENYIEQFKIFVEDIPATGSLIYSQNDTTLNELVSNANIKATKIPYLTPSFIVTDGTVYWETILGKTPLKFFGTHNLQNMMAAKHACQAAGVSEKQFIEAIQSFKGTAKRLETIYEDKNCMIIRDFAHAPSKLKATVNAVKERNPERKLIAIYELHTFSSLNKAFLNQYHGSMEKADVKAVLYSEHTLKMKNMPMLSKEEIGNGFGDDVVVFNDANELKEFIKSHFTKHENLVMMSSGTFDGMDLTF